MFKRKFDHLLLVVLCIPTRLRDEKRVVLEGRKAHPVLEGVVEGTGESIPVGDQPICDEVGMDRVRAVEMYTVAVDVGRVR